MNLDHGTSDWRMPEFHETQYWREFARKGRTFIDIGAHVGTWTLNLAPYFERVFAFEPDPRSYTTLRKNLELNGITNVQVIPSAVSNVTGSTRMYFFPSPASNTILDPAACLRTDPYDSFGVVPTVSLDEFVATLGITDIDFLKVDAEAAEMLILEGAQKTLSEQRPDFFIEMHGLFYDRLRKLLPGIECDVLDGGRAGLSLLRHRDSWPSFETPDFKIWPHGTRPTIEGMKEIRKRHGIEWDAPGGFLAEDSCASR